MVAAAKPSAAQCRARATSRAHSTVLSHLADQVAQHLELRFATIQAVRANRGLRTEAEQRAAATELAARMLAAAAQAATPHRERGELGGAAVCTASAELKIADSWGDSAWGCTSHVEEALIKRAVGVHRQRRTRRTGRLRQSLSRRRGHHRRSAARQPTVKIRPDSRIGRQIEQ
jgi:hypothetical protein